MSKHDDTGWKCLLSTRYLVFIYLVSHLFFLSLLSVFLENNNAIKDVHIFCFVGVNMLTSIGNKFEFMFYVT